jgi:diguanylate cyclase (GGDEF)-like protein/PAS domain S-box-containing protein
MTDPGPGGNRRAEAAIGAGLALLGAAVAIGWILRIPVLVQVSHGLTPMVLNTALCFVLSGMAVLASLRPQWRRAVQALASGLLALSAAVTLQYAVGADFGIDAPALHRWLSPDIAVHPGRMSAFTGIAFIAASLGMLLATGPSRGGTDTLALAFATVTGAVGALALLGYLFELNLVYARYALGLVALHTAAGLLALCAALWLRFVRERRVHFWKRLAPQDRITLASATILTLVALAVAVGVFAALQARVTQALSDGLATSLRYRVLLAEEAIEAGLQRTRILAGRPAPARALRRLEERSGDTEAAAQLSQSAASLVAGGYLAVSYYDARGRQIVAAGRELRDPALVVALPGSPGATLAWKDGFVISERYAISDATGTVGAAVVQTPVHALDDLLNDAYRLGQTGEVGMCTQLGERLGCFPQRQVAEVYFVPARASDGAPLPMTRGLEGESGVVLTRDYRGENVIAAYAPVAKSALAMVVKMDTAEIYAPVRERLLIVLPVLAILIAAGTWLQRARVRPLAARLAQSERAAQDRHHALESMMANVADGMMLLEADGTIRSWNAAAQRLFGYSAEEVVGRNLSMLVPEDLREANIAATHRFLATGESKVIGRAGLSYPARRKDGSRFDLEFTVTRMWGGEAPRLVAVFRDITERKKAERWLTQLALHDALTGLPNRANFDQHVEDAFARLRRSGGQLALMLMDVDRFKRVNDSLGHAAGDLLLAAFAKRIKGAVRESDFVARVGGDEFTIVTEGLRGTEDATAIAEKVLAAMRDPLDVDGNTLKASASIGIALYSEGDTPKTLMHRADVALYEAKGAGRARYSLEK